MNAPHAAHVSGDSRWRSSEPLSDEALRGALDALRMVPNAWPERLEQLEAELIRRNRMLSRKAA